MTLSGLASLITKSDNTFLLSLFAMMAMCVYVIREMVKLRKEVGKISVDKFTERRNAVLEIFKTLDELKKHDLEELELKAIKERFLKDLNMTMIAERQPAPSAHADVANFTAKSTRTYIPENLSEFGIRQRIGLFFRSMFLFGFMSVWSGGWGFGMASVGLPVIRGLWMDIYVGTSELSIFSLATRSLMLILSIIIYIGVGIVPVVMALGGGGWWIDWHGYRDHPERSKPPDREKRGQENPQMGVINARLLEALGAYQFCPTRQPGSAS